MNEVQQNEQMMRDAFVMSELRARQQHASKMADYYKCQMWICFIGWVVTAVILMWGAR